MDSLPPHILLDISLSSISLTKVLGLDLEEPASPFPPTVHAGQMFICVSSSPTQTQVKKTHKGVLSELVLVRNLEGGSSLDRHRRPQLR